MDLTELQSELRSIGKKVKELETAVGQMKPKTETQKVNEYKFLTDLASRYPLSDRGLDKAEKNTQNMYIKILVNMAFLEEDHQQERLLYTARIAAGIDQQRPFIEQSIESSTRFDETDMADMCVDIEPVKENFLLDAFIIANICGKASERMLSFLAELAVLFNCDHPDIEILTAVSKGLLTNNLSYLDTIKCDIPRKWRGKFSNMIPDQWFTKYRIFCGRYCIRTPKSFLTLGSSTPECQVISSLDSGTNVHKRDILVSFLEPSKVKYSISAPMDGIVYFIKDRIKNESLDRHETFIMVYVVNGLDNFESFCKWYKDREITQLIKDQERRGKHGNIADK